VIRKARRSRTERVAAAVRPLLFSAIDTGDIDVRAIDGLGRAGRRALDTQARALLPQLRGEDHDNLVRLLDHGGAVRAARRQVRSRRPGARARAGRFLGDVGRAAALDDLVLLLHDPSPGVRWSAARSLGRMGDPSAVHPLLASLAGDRPVPPGVVVDAIAEIRDCPVAVLRQGLASRSAPVRAVSVELLGRFQALNAIAEVVCRMQTDPSVEVRTRAAQALGRMGSPRAVEPLLAALTDGPPAMQPQVLWALGEIGAPDTVPALRTALTAPSPDVRQAAASALGAVRAQPTA
jgi:HEAT repeat protein